MPHRHRKRHYYQCGDQTLSWQSDWYTQPWFTESRQSYDQAASTGPVDPPLSIIESVSSCSALLASASAASSSTSALANAGGPTGVQPGLVTRTSVFTGRTSGGVVQATTYTSVYTSTVPISTSAPTLSSSVTSTVVSSVTAAAGSTTDYTSLNTCAGHWDFQGWGTVACLGVGVIIGGLIWLLWGVLRGGIRELYSPRTWFLPPDSRPSKSSSFLGFLLPFLHLPSLASPTPLSSSHLSLHTMLAALKLGALSSLLALTAALPLITAGVPCLAATAPSNNLGGRLGTLTDLSLLRLLNALDPSPNSIASSRLIHLPPYIRDLPSTISPAVSNARVRLIILLAILAVLGCGGGLFIIARTYATFARYRRHFETKICSTLEMVIIPSNGITAWEGLKEERVQKWLQRHFEGEKGGDKKEIDVIRVFAIPDTPDWREQLVERDRALDLLEQAEARYIESLKSIHAPSNAEHEYPLETPGCDHVESHRTVGVGPGQVDTPGQADTSSGTAMGVEQSKFKEINRDSAIYGGRFPLGQRIKLNEKGEFIPDPSPESENESPLSVAGQSNPDDSPPLREEPPTLTIHPGPAKRPEIQPTPAVASSAAPSREETSPFDGGHRDIREGRGRLKELNEQIERSQQRAFASVAKGENTIGWIIVGRNVRFLPHTERIEGFTREDIVWQNVGLRYGEGMFWSKVALIGGLLATIMVPFIGLSVATAPGFAYYLDFLGPIARSDGFGSGVVQGLVPAIGITLAVGLAVFAIKRSAKQVKAVSRTRQRNLAYKAAFHLTLFTTLFWLLTVAALEYAVQGFALDVQAARTVGDGAVYSTWFVFVALLNIAIIGPGVYLLQPKKLLKRFGTRRKATTPRQRFRRNHPSSFEPAYGLLPFLVAVFYAFSLVFIFPLLAIPIMLLLFLAMCASRYMANSVCIEMQGYSGGVLELWTIRRFGWVLGTQPALFGLVLLSRREWGIGAASLAVAGATIALSEGLTVLRYPTKRLRDLSGETRRQLSSMRASLSQPRDTPPEMRTRISDSSMLARLTALLPGYGRLPADCPLPLETEKVDDILHTEQAAHRRPDLHESEGDRQYFHDPTASMRGLLYPSELLAPPPVVWLPYDGVGVAVAEAADLDGDGLVAVVDPPPSAERGRVRQEERLTDAGTPLLR